MRLALKLAKRGHDVLQQMHIQRQLERAGLSKAVTRIFTLCAIPGRRLCGRMALPFRAQTDAASNHIHKYAHRF
jgi:hypothetical protein